MAWDLNERGMIGLTPLMTWETAIITETSCGIRLVFATPEDGPHKDPIVVQTALTVEQAEELISHLQQMVDRIRQPPDSPPH